MPWALHIDIVDPSDDTIKVTHTFWGQTRDECLTYKKHHLASCEYFQAAEDDGRTFEEFEQVAAEDMPEVEIEEEEQEEQEEPRP